MKARLYEKYKSEVVPALKQKHNYANVHQVPKLEKIVVNMGVSASLEKNAIEDAAKDLSLITGRKAAISKSRHSIANFKLRENVPIGCRVTLRQDAMYEFFDRLVATALPRIRDFRGLSPRKFDGRGNYTSGNRAGQDQADAGNGHHDCDERPGRRRGAGVVEDDGFSVCRGEGSAGQGRRRSQT
jgi:large subunit ribosomal protein L5